MSGHEVLYAAMRSAEIQIAAGRTGRLLWTGEAALRAMALLLGRPVEIELIATAEPIVDHPSNLSWSPTKAILEMALALDEGVSLSSLPCVLEA
ncbi:MAG: hypothetical protein IT372_12180 [Polyangiaceae bacterium]|nr:hypothetical protein [Polyangiaceae bacterium]